MLKKQKASNETKHAAMVYCGPGIKGIVRRDTVFSGALPEELIRLLDRQPLLKELTVPVDKLAETQKQLSDKSSRLYIIYKQAEKTLQI